MSDVATPDAGMQSSSPEAAPKRSAGLAAFLSLLTPGLGHWYLGDLRTASRALVLLSVGPGLFVMAFLQFDVTFLAAVATAVFGRWLIYFGLAVHAWRRARAPGFCFAPTRAHTRHGYVLFMVLGLALSMSSSWGLRSFVVEPFKVPAGSNRPTIEPDDHVAVSKFRARDREGRRGDIVIFPYPDDPDETFIKRIVALGGETLRFDEDGLPLVDGYRFVRRPCPSGLEVEVDAWKGRCFIETNPEGLEYEVWQATPVGATGPADLEPAPDGGYVVPAGEVFVLGDNRSLSADSRMFGSIPVNSVLGRARSIWLPFDRMGNIEPTHAEK